MRAPDKDGITLRNSRVVVEGIGVVSGPQITFVCLELSWYCGVDGRW